MSISLRQVKTPLYHPIHPRFIVWILVLQSVFSNIIINFDKLDTLDFTFSMVSDRCKKNAPYIKPTWILLDTESTCSIFNNRRLVYNIRKIPRGFSPLRTLINGGKQTSDHIATVRNFGGVWFNPKSLANILSLAQVRKVCRVSMDTDIEAAMLVHRKDGYIIKFIAYFDCAQNDNHDTKSKASLTNYSFVVTTVEGNILAVSLKERNEHVKPTSS